ncbi:MAG: hypothetical protein E3J88_01965 [Anaerolineales bacterium]|nr:MAG: hypothetical protein E3J88_01965 [Anaerolineales bacterium]
MVDILKDLSTPALVKAIKANRFGYYRYLANSPKAELNESPQITWLLSGIPVPFLNNVLHTQLTPDNVDEKIEETLAYLKSRNITKLAWWTEPGTLPANLGEHLTAHGLTYTDSEPGMAVDLLALNEDVTLSSELAVEHVGDGKTLKKFAKAAAVGFGIPDASEGCFELLSGLGFELPLRNYIGLLNGKPAATSQMFLGAGVAGIYWVATVPEARRQGFGALMTLAPLIEAREMGYRVGILHSSPMGFGIYTQLGFREYCRMSNYEWDSERTPE